MYCGSLSFSLNRKQLSAQREQLAQASRHVRIRPSFCFKRSLILSVSTFASAHLVIELLSFCGPDSAPARQTVLSSHGPPEEEEKHHMPDLRKGQGDEQEIDRK